MLSLLSSFFDLTTSCSWSNSSDKEKIKELIAFLRKCADDLEAMLENYKKNGNKKDDSSWKEKVEKELSSVKEFIQKLDTQKKEKSDEAIDKLISGFGGLDNISKFGNCASRLRYDIVDKSKVDEAILKSAGVIAIKWINQNHIQAVVGPKAEIIAKKILERTEGIE